MTGSATGNEATEADTVQRHLERLVGRLLLVALFTSQGLEGFVLHDFDNFDIINATVLNATVRMVMSDQSRFTVNITLSTEELGGEIRFDYMDSIKGVRVPPLVLRKYAQFSLSSTRMDLGSGGIPPASDIHVSQRHCGRQRNADADTVLRCPRGSTYDQHGGHCSMKCTADDDCTSYLGVEADCLLYKCICKSGTYVIGNACAYPKACKNDSDCGLWLHMKCARTRPGSNDTFCRCADNAAPATGLLAIQQPTWVPVHTAAATRNTPKCDQSTSTCLCKKGYELRIYGTNWVCEKKDTEVVDRVCMDETQCYTGEICDENICKCPKGTELQNLQCAAIKLPKVRTNLALFLWLSAAMMVLIVVFLSFGCCLYLLAQRAENEQEAIANMFDVSDDFSIKDS
ncbi:hypothetical protein MTO96_041847 [Rhipicephalus appendiculatus]